MKSSISLLLLCLFFALCSTLSAQHEFGLRVFYQNDLTQSSDALTQGAAAGEWEYGAFFRHSFSRHSAIRLEANFLRARYRLSDEHYGSLKFCVIPEWQISPLLSIGGGGFAGFLLFDAFDTQKKVETGVLANIALRYGHFGIHGRLQRTFVQDHKHGLGVGLTYHFGKKSK